MMKKYTLSSRVRKMHVILCRKFRMTVYLDELDLLRHTETPLNQLLEDNLESGNGLVRNDKKCKSRIVQRIHDAQLEYVKGQETAYDV
jgi:hypothetical protein